MRRAGAGIELWVYDLALLAAAVAVWTTRVTRLHGAPAMPVAVPWPALAVVFALAEAYGLRLRFGRGAYTISLREVGLVLGLYALSPGSLLLAQIAGAAAALTLLRRETPAKIAGTLVELALTTTVAVVVFRSLPGAAHPFDPAGWSAALAACVAASLLGLLLATAEIGVVEGELVLAPGAAAVSVLATVAITNLTLVGVELARTDVRATALLVLPAAIGALAFRALGARVHRHEHLEFLYESMRAAQASPARGVAVGALLVALRRLVGADYAEILLFPDGDEPGLRSALGAHGETTTRVESVDVDDERALAAALAADGPITLPEQRPSHPLDGFLAARSLPDAIIAAVVAESGPLGFVVVGGHTEEGASFHADDRRLLSTLAAHLSVTLEKGRLERSLAEVNDVKERLAHQAQHDALTGLANRALLTERVDAALARRHRDAAVLFVDLDDFKLVNDTLGHAAGDELLREVARRIVDGLRPGDTAARLGGDEFAVLLETADHRGAETVASSLLGALQRPFELGGRSLNVGASIGIALAGAAASAEEFLRNADVAMYAAKAAGKHGLRLYAPAMDARARARREFARDLEGALERDEIGLVFAPIVDLRDGTTLAVEALARWHSPNRGVVPAARFIPLAEETGLMLPIGRAVLHRACAAAADWSPAGTVSVSVNLSASEIANHQLAELVAAELEATGLAPHLLMLELAETDVMQSVEVAVARMEELRALGVRLVLDDFGTGHSSLERLDTFPVDAVKIAKPFVDRLLGPASASPFIEAFVRLTRSLDMGCIAEGVEHNLQVQRLLERGCAFAQGYHLASPMPGEELERYLAAGARVLPCSS